MKSAIQKEVLLNILNIRLWAEVDSSKMFGYYGY